MRADSEQISRPPEAVCPKCDGQGGLGDERCAIVICDVCHGTGLPPDPGPVGPVSSASE
ncbi:MAG: hypothetical protein ACRDH6_01470 [Actinomycetota bacterium]